MEWQAVVLAIQILLLAAEWLLFQRARGELSARAAETPVLAEVKALQQRVQVLLTDLESATDRQAARLESGCADAIAVLTEIENKIHIAERILAQSEHAGRLTEERRVTAEPHPGDAVSSHGTVNELQGVVIDSRLVAPESQGISAVVNNGDPGMESGHENRTRDEEIYSLADGGLSTAAIAHAMRLSEGEVEMMLGLRGRR
jgi:hypothetical protein